MRVVLTGSRKYPPNDFRVERLIDEACLRFPGTGVEVAHGGAKGFDSCMDAELRRIGWTNIKVFRPDYERYPGKQAPIIRNRQMLTWALEHDRSLVVGMLPKDGWGSGGTYFTLNLALESGMDVKVFRFGTGGDPHPQSSQRGGCSND